MKVEFRPADYSDEVSECLAGWYADPETAALYFPRNAEGVSPAPARAEEVRRSYADRKHPDDFELLVYVDNAFVGLGTVSFDPPQRMTREGKVAWFSLLIGEKEYRGRGIGRRLRVCLEEMAKERGATHVEAGIFEFNEASLGLVRSMGYREIGRREGVTFHLGRSWADIRLLKVL